MTSAKKQEDMRIASSGTGSRVDAPRNNLLDIASLDPACGKMLAELSPGARNSVRIYPQRLITDQRQFRLQNRSRTQKPELSVTEFVRKKLIPEHFSTKKAASQVHYRAILKHVLDPSEVDRIFQSKDRSKSRLKPTPEWPYLGDMNLSDVRPAHVQKLMTAAQERGYSSQTVLHIRNVVSVIFAHAKRCNYYVGANPALLVKMPKMTRKFSYSMTLAEIKNILGLMHYPEKEMALVVMLTGANIAEVCGMQWKCVNLTGSSADIGGDLIPGFSIGIRKQWHRGNVTDINRKGVRNVEIPELLLGTFLKLRSLPRCVEPDDFVFASRTGAPINPTNISVRRLKPIGERLQIPSMSWYLFRRAYVALTSKSGAEAHQSIAMSLYSESSRGELAKGFRSDSE